MWLVIDPFAIVQAGVGMRNDREKIMLSGA
jgi:hypothetical protein